MITSAGLVLAGTFAVLATLPVVAFAQIGFAVAFGVLLDTLVVRSVLVTALNLDVGGRMWWPSARSATGCRHRRHREPSFSYAARWRCYWMTTFTSLYITRPASLVMYRYAW